jgi:hypothetical protein
MTTHPGLRHIGEHRAVTDRLEAAVPAPRCCWCAVEMRDTPKRAVCDHMTCQQLETQKWGVVTVGSLATESRMAFAQYVAADARNAKSLHETYLRAEVRFRRALAALVGRKA